MIKAKAPGPPKPGASNTAAATRQDGIGFDQLLNVLNVEPHEHVSIFYKLDDESKHAAVVRAVDAVRYVENEVPDAWATKSQASWRWPARQSVLRQFGVITYSKRSGPVAAGGRTNSCPTAPCNGGPHRPDLHHQTRRQALRWCFEEGNVPNSKPLTLSRVSSYLLTDRKA